MELDRQRAIAQRRHEKRPDLYPKTFYISSACYSDNTKQMLDELKKSFDKSSWCASRWEIVDEPWTSIIDLVESYVIKEGLADEHGIDGGIAALKTYNRWKEQMYRFIPTGGGWREGKPDIFRWCISPIENNKICKLQTEETKMNAKRCDRCGKLYVPNDEHHIKAYLYGRVTEHEKETYTPEKIREYNTFQLRAIFDTDGRNVDMCPDCLKKLTEFFESGADEVKE